jgi:hypothetical protein
VSSIQEICFCSLAVCVCPLVVKLVWPGHRCSIVVTVITRSQPWHGLVSKCFLHDITGYCCSGIGLGDAGKSLTDGTSKNWSDGLLNLFFQHSVKSAVLRELLTINEYSRSLRIPVTRASTLSNQHRAK